jgi:hypothetical protein
VAKVICPAGTDGWNAGLVGAQIRKQYNVRGLRRILVIAAGKAP